MKIWIISPDTVQEGKLITERLASKNIKVKLMNDNIIMEDGYILPAQLLVICSEENINEVVKNTNADWFSDDDTEDQD